MPADGVYAGQVFRLDEWGRTLPGGPLAAAAISVGTNPTFEVRQRRIEAGELPTFLSETKSVRESDWQVAKAPKDLHDRRVEM